VSKPATGVGEVINGVSRIGVTTKSARLEVTERPYPDDGSGVTGRRNNAAIGKAQFECGGGDTCRHLCGS